MSLEKLSRFRANSTAHAILFSLSIGMAIAIVAITVRNDRDTFRAHQADLLMTSMKSLREDIFSFVDHRNSVARQFVANNLDAISHIADNPDDLAAIDRLERSMKGYFGEMFAFHVSGGDGRGGPDDFGEFVGERCHRDISLYRDDLNHSEKTAAPVPLYEPYIHPQPHAYHFDIIIGWPDNKTGKAGAFFVSFPTASLEIRVRRYEREGHKLMLLNSAIDGLLEVTSQGARDKFIREDYRMTPKERQAILFRLPIENTRWIVAGALQEDFVSENLKDGIFRGVLVCGMLVLLWIAGMIVGYRFHKRNGQALAMLSVATERAELANQTKSEFLATMSHEIRTPMTGVLGFADALMEDELPHASRHKVERIKEAALSLLTIINEVLDLSKLEAGKVEIENINFDLPPLLREVVSMFEGSGRADLKVMLDCDDDALGAVYGDPTRLRQVLINLVGNAVKFTNKGQVTLFVEKRSKGDGEDVLYFAVIDTGIGISDDVLPKLFNEFTQADSSISREFEGTGLGLAICKRLVALMGGEIGVESQLGEGSTFWFTLPYEAAKSDVVKQTATAGEMGLEIQTMRPLHILVAEDNQVNQMIISQTLDRFSHSYEMVNDGNEAVETLEAKVFDLILMDVRMPKVSGPNATRMIRKMTGGKAQIPIIALTADAMLEHQKGYIEAGMNGVSTKPIDRFELARTINEVMGEEIHAFVKGKAADAGAQQMPPPLREPEVENDAVADFLASLDGFAEDQKTD